MKYFRKKKISREIPVIAKKFPCPIRNTVEIEKKQVEIEKEQVENLDAWAIKKTAYRDLKLGSNYSTKVEKKAEAVVKQNANEIIKTQYYSKALTRQNTMVFDTIFSPNSSLIKRRSSLGYNENLFTYKEKQRKCETETLQNGNTISADITSKNMVLESLGSSKYNYLQQKLEKKKLEENQMILEKSRLLIRLAQLKESIKELKASDQNGKAYQEELQKPTPKRPSELSLTQIRNKEQHTLKVYNEQILVLKKELLENAGKLNKLHEKCRSIKCEVAKIRENQCDHYHEILAKGADTRNEGLSWIIKAIYNLGKNVNYSKFPAFLDQEAREYLLSVKLFFADGFSIQKRILN